MVPRTRVVEEVDISSMGAFSSLRKSPRFVSEIIVGTTEDLDC